MRLHRCEHVLFPDELRVFALDRNDVDGGAGADSFVTEQLAGFQGRALGKSHCLMTAEFSKAAGGCASGETEPGVLIGLLAGGMEQDDFS